MNSLDELTIDTVTVNNWFRTAEDHHHWKRTRADNYLIDGSFVGVSEDSHFSACVDVVSEYCAI